MEDNDIYYIEKILDRKKINDKYLYKIKWEGYPMSQSTWEPVENLKTAIELVQEYDKLHPLEFINRKRKPSKKMREIKKGKEENNNPPLEENKEEVKQVKEENNENNEKNKIEEEQPNNIITLEENIKQYNIDDSLKKVTTVRKRDNKLMAAVEKMKENGGTEEIEVETFILKKDNPWILLDFYESKIKFT